MLWKRAKSVVLRPPSPSGGQRKRLVEEHRTTITLKNPGLLRGCKPSVLLSDFGRRLRSTAGGIGAVAEEADNEYAHSYVVNELDVFLSHSWHAPWQFKYLVLLFFFNLKMALVTAISVGILSFLVQRHFHENTPADVVLSKMLSQHGHSTFLTSPSLNRDSSSCLDVTAFCYSLLLGGVAFTVMLLLWHNIRELFGGAQSIFLDKVCIHQTNAELKAAGINSIGAVLASSKMVFVCWDSTYFSRLWCTYELSAYQKREDGRILVMPQDLGGFTVAATFVSVMHCIARYFVWRGVKWELVAGCAFVPLLLLMSRIRKYLQELEALKYQLEHFSVEQTRCFCCDNKHCHPDTKQVMPCDREVVYKSIAHWHGDGDIKKGLKRFDSLVQTKVKQDMERTLGKAAKLPYKHALVVSMPPFFQAIDWHLACDLVPSLSATLSQLMLRYPLCLALILFSIDVFKAKPTARKCFCLSEDFWTRFIDSFIELGLAILSFLIIFGFTVAGDYFLYECERVWVITWASLQFVAVVFLYWKNDSAVQNTKWTLEKIGSVAQAMSTEFSSKPTATFSAQATENNFELEMSSKNTSWVQGSKNRMGASSLKELSLPRSPHSLQFGALDSTPRNPMLPIGSSPASSQQSQRSFSSIASPRSALSKKNNLSASPFLMPSLDSTQQNFPPLIEESFESEGAYDEV